jgi:hypothetical protein
MAFHPGDRVLVKYRAVREVLWHERLITGVCQASPNLERAGQVLAGVGRRQIYHFDRPMAPAELARLMQAAQTMAARHIPSGGAVGVPPPGLPPPLEPGRNRAVVYGGP